MKWIKRWFLKPHINLFFAIGHEEQRSYLSSDPLAQGIVENFFTSTSRYKLMSTLSSMRRLDPRETGVLSFMEIQDVMSAHSIKANSWVLNELLARYSVTQHQVDYRKMWKFVMGITFVFFFNVLRNELNFWLMQAIVGKLILNCFKNILSFLFHINIKMQMNINLGFVRIRLLCTYDWVQFPFISNISDCYAVKDHIDPPARESAVRRIPQKSQDSFLYLSPGLKSEVEFELRQYARVHQKLIDLQEMKKCMDSLDKFGTGRLLHKQVNDLNFPFALL